MLHDSNIASWFKLCLSNAVQMTTDCAYCLQGMRTVRPHVAAQFCEIVKLRNKLARNLGYEDFYDYKVVFVNEPHMHTCSDRMTFNRMKQGRRH